MNLYEINQAILAALTPDDDGVLADDAMDKLSELMMVAEEKLENIGCLLKDWRAEADAIKAEADRLTERRKAIENRADRLRQYAADMMVAMGKSKLETARCVLSFRSSSAVDVLDESVIPDEYFKTKRDLQKAEISKALKAGLTVPGAALVERANLQIK